MNRTLAAYWLCAWHLLTIPIYSHAQESIIGLVTIHVQNPDQVGRNFEGKLTKSGETILNPILAQRLVVKQDYMHYYSYGGLVGLNSIGEFMAGIMVSKGLYTDSFRLGIVTGGYAQNSQHFRERDIIPFSLIESHQLGIVPIIGLEYVQKISKKLLTNVLISPIVINIGLGIEL